MEKLKVLVVDDEPGIRSGIIRILNKYQVGFPFMDEDFCYECIEAETGEEAIAIINKEKIDIILLDNKLPGIEGIEVLEYMTNNKYDALVMMITSYASLDLAVKATKNGAYNFVPKPFTPEELKSAMENITKHLFLKRITQKMTEDDKQIRFQFLSVLSHELKSPINAVESYLSMMIEKQAGELVENYTEMLERSVVRLKGMRNLITDLLDLTKIGTGEKTRELTECDITEIAKYSIETFKPLALQKNITLHFDAPAIVKMNADRQEIEIIFNNLISNSIKYNIQNGHVYITIKKNENEILISVKDTGIGMCNDDISKLFHDFVRIKNTKTNNITGTGLGLSITKKIVELYNGSIDVTSIPGTGSTFIVTFLRGNNITKKK